MDPWRPARGEPIPVVVNGPEAAKHIVASRLAPFAARVRLIDHPARELPRVILFDTAVDRPVLEEIRTLVECGSARVILFSAAATVTLIDAARAVGASGLVAKDDDPQLLVEHIEAVARGERVGLDVTAVAFCAPPLTAREADVLSLVALGLTNQQIGGELFVSVETVRTHVRTILRKLGVANRTQAATRAFPGGRVFPE